MSAKTGLWSAFGALLGGVAGVAAGHYAATMRPRARYATAGRDGASVEDAMVVGGATGAVVGAFLGGAIGAETPPAQSPQQLPR